MPSTTTKHINLTVRGSGQVCSSSSMISGGSKPNRMWLHLYLTQHQSGDASLAVSRAEPRSGMLYSSLGLDPAHSLFSSSSTLLAVKPHIERGARLLPVPPTHRTSVMVQQQGREPVDEGNGKSGEDQSADMLFCLIYIPECDWLSRL